MTVSKLIGLWVTLLPKGTPGFGGTLLLGHTLLLGVTLLLEATLPFNEYSTTCVLGLTPRPFHTISLAALFLLFLPITFTLPLPISSTRLKPNQIQNSMSTIFMSCFIAHTKNAIVIR